MPQASAVEGTSPDVAGDPESLPPPEQRGWKTVALGFANRVFLTYFFLEVFPYPLSELPFLGFLGDWQRKAFETLVLGLAKAFGIAADPTPTGSSDTPYRYLQAATLLALALLAALVWTLVRRGAAVDRRVEDATRTYLRLCLAATLLAYGWQKIFPVQMSPPGPDRLLLPLGESSPMGMVWNFMGMSAPYQIFAGLGEATAGFLLLWRRTALLGALLGAGVMTNVVALNLCYDVPVKLSSSLYLLLLLFLLAPHFGRLTSFLLLHRTAKAAPLEPFPIRRRWLRYTVLALHLAFAAWVTIGPARQAYGILHSSGRLAPRGPLDGLYRVESFSRDGVLDRGNEDATRWVRVGIHRSGLGTIVRANGRAVRYYLAVLPPKKVLILASYDDPDTQPELLYSEPSPGILRLEGSFEGAKTVVVLRQEPDSGLLMNRGFHWINEAPLNR